MKFTVITFLVIALLSPLEASESDESDSSETSLSYKEHRRNAPEGQPLMPLSGKNIKAFFDYFQHEPKPQALHDLGKLGRENIHRSMNWDVDTKAAAPKPKSKVAAKVDFSMKLIKYKKVFNVNK